MRSARDLIRRLRPSFVEPAAVTPAAVPAADCSNPRCHLGFAHSGPCDTRESGHDRSEVVSLDIERLLARPPRRVRRSSTPSARSVSATKTPAAMSRAARRARNRRARVSRKANRP